MTVHWGEKRYYSLDYYLKKTYGEKLYKISLDGGMTCPNRDGTLGTHGCIFCSRGGSGDFAASRTLSVTEQIEAGKQQSAKKYTGSSYIAYFQAYTNTYASLEYLETLYMEAITHPDIRILSIATRPDCLSEKILDLLENLNRIKPVWVELGLQTIHEESARYIRRGYELPVFENAVSELRKRGIDVIVHTILCLPNETEPPGYSGHQTAAFTCIKRYRSGRHLPGLSILHSHTGRILSASRDVYQPLKTGHRYPPINRRRTKKSFDRPFMDL